jgi:uncharacterized membrane protein YqjE
VRLLWSLPKAAPALLRHLVAYAELAGQDLEQTKTDIRARLIAAIVLLICVFFALMCGCLVVIALTWDTSNRVAAIAWMGGSFLLVAIVCGLYRSKIVGGQAPFLSTVRREWAEDRVILEKILADQD